MRSAIVISRIGERMTRDCTASAPRRPPAGAEDESNEAAGLGNPTADRHIESFAALRRVISDILLPIEKTRAAGFTFAAFLVFERCLTLRALAADWRQRWCNLSREEMHRVRHHRI